MATLSHPPSTPRVDAVVTADGPLLMELELIEPELYFELAPESQAPFCEALEARVAR